MEEEDSEVALPMSVERMIGKICFNQYLPPPDTETRKVLASIGQHKSMHILKIISQAGRIRNLNCYITHLSKHEPHSTSTQSPTTSTYLSPPNSSVSSLSATDDFIFQSPFPEHFLPSSSPNVDMTRSPVATGGSSSSNVQRISNRVETLLLASGNSYSPTRKKLVFSPPTNTNRESTYKISKQLLILFELEFRKMFLILNYIGRKKIEDVVSIDDACKILELKDETMANFESHVWSKYGRFLVGNGSTDRRKCWSLTYIY